MTQADPSLPVAVRRFAWRRLFQYSLRSLLVLVTLCAVLFACWSHSAQTQRDAVAALRKMGVEVIIHYDFEDHQLKGPRFWPAWLVDALGVDYFARVTLVAIKGNTDTGIDLTRLKVLAHLQVLAFAEITDADLEPLQGLSSLQSLQIVLSSTTDGGLERIGRLSTLTELSLEYDNNISDAGLEHLNGLISLQSLNLTGTPVTDAGVARLQQALPNCKIRR